MNKRSSFSEAIVVETRRLYRYSPTVEMYYRMRHVFMAAVYPIDDSGCEGNLRNVLHLDVVEAQRK